jgi:hypothetical protein
LRQQVGSRDPAATCNVIRRGVILRGRQYLSGSTSVRVWIAARVAMANSGWPEPATS